MGGFLGRPREATMKWWSSRWLITSAFEIRCHRTRVPKKSGWAVFGKAPEPEEEVETLATFKIPLQALLTSCDAGGKLPLTKRRKAAADPEGYIEIYLRVRSPLDGGEEWCEVQRKCVGDIEFH